MRRKVLVVSTLLLVRFSLAAEPQEVNEPAKQAGRAFLKAFAAGETAGMGKHYADEVIVIRGSTLLEKNHGGLGPDGATDKNCKVKKAALLAAYEKTIKALGGKKEWVKRGKDLEKKIEFSTVKAFIAKFPKAGERCQEIEAKPDDVLLILNPKGDMAVFFLRAERPAKDEEEKAKKQDPKKGSSEKWVVYAEQWD
jgi:hypothetical protein